jgi:hypothetical protein
MRDFDAGRRQRLATVGFGEEAPSIAVLPGVQQLYGRNGERFNESVHALQIHHFRHATAIGLAAPHGPVMHVRGCPSDQPNGS